MSLKAGVGIEYGNDAYTVGANAASLAIEHLGEKPDALLVFSSVKYDQWKMLQGVRSVGGYAVIVGSSTAGEITTNGPALEKSVAVMALKSPDIKFFGGVGEHVKQNPAAAGAALARSVSERSGEPALFMMFPDILNGDGAELVRGVLAVLGNNIPIVGGASGDDFEFRETYQYLNDRVYSGAVVGLGLKGNLKIGIGLKHGWVPIGEPLIVTRSEGSVIYEFNNRPAVSIYQEYFGMQEAENLRKEPLAKLAITYPLGMVVEGGDELLIRDPLTVNRNGSITCAAAIPEGTEVRLMFGSRDEAIKAAEQAAEQVLKELNGNPPKAIIVFNCIARHKLFGHSSKEEIEVIQNVLGNRIPLIGFYTYGEQAPFKMTVQGKEKNSAAFYNETIVICALAD